MAEIPGWHVTGEWFDNCSCAIACPCTFAQPPDNGFCEFVLFWHIDRGHYGSMKLDGLNFARVGRWEGDLWAGKVKGGGGSFVDERADERQAEALLSILSVALELARVLNDVDREYLLSHAVSQGAGVQTVRVWVKDIIAQRAAAPATTPATAAIVPVDRPPVITTVCAWCHQEVPLESTIAFRVCPDDFTMLQAAREDWARAQPPAAADSGPKEG